MFGTSAGTWFSNEVVLKVRMRTSNETLKWRLNNVVLKSSAGTPPNSVYDCAWVSVTTPNKQTLNTWFPVCLSNSLVPNYQIV